MRAPDPAFADARLAVLYDDLDPDRSDLDAYVAIVDEVAARTVLDIGCGTGCLAVRLAESGVDVVGLDPAGASLAVARAKPHAERVRWMEGDADSLADLEQTFDLVVMTGNVAQVFVSDNDWSRTLEAVRSCLRPGGWLVFETRRPEARAWESWDDAPHEVTLPDGTGVTLSRTVVEVASPLVTFESVTLVGGEHLRSASTLRFRTLDELERDLRSHGFEVTDVREAPDRRGLEHVLLARAEF